MVKIGKHIGNVGYVVACIPLLTAKLDFLILYPPLGPLTLILGAMTTVVAVVVVSGFLLPSRMEAQRTAFVSMIMCVLSLFLCAYLLVKHTVAIEILDKSITVWCIPGDTRTPFALSQYAGQSDADMLGSEGFIGPDKLERPIGKLWTAASTERVRFEVWSAYTVLYLSFAAFLTSAARLNQKNPRRRVAQDEKFAEA